MLSTYVLREMQIKAAGRHHHVLLRVARMKEKFGPSPVRTRMVVPETRGGNTERAALWERSLVVSYK